MKNIILSCGAGHPFDATSALVAGILKYEGIDSTVTSDVEEATAALPAAALFTVNALVPTLAEAGRAAVVGHLGRGGGILALHGAVVSFPDWEKWRGIVGGAPGSADSSHGDAGPVRVSVRTGGHIITAGLGGFEVIDEPYLLDGYDADNDVLATSAGPGGDVPVVWARAAGGGRIVGDALGHDERSLSHPAHRIMLCRAARWVLSMSFEREWDEA